MRLQTLLWASSIRSYQNGRIYFSAAEETWKCVWGMLFSTVSLCLSPLDVRFSFVFEERRDVTGGGSTNSVFFFYQNLQHRCKDVSSRVICIARLGAVSGAFEVMFGRFLRGKSDQVEVIYGQVFFFYWEDWRQKGSQVLMCCIRCR